jgi:hypothetical protein
MDKEKLRIIAEKVLNEAKIPNDPNYGAIITILMIISIILTVIRVLQECNKSKLNNLSNAQDRYALYGSDIREFSAKRGWFTKMKIKKLLRRELSPEQYEKYGMRLLDSLLRTGETVTDDEVITLVEAANV